MYTFEDRGGRSLTLRPEGTAGVMRALSGTDAMNGVETRVFYIGPMFRGEKPAAGRRRQFHQIGVENAGRVAPALAAECILSLTQFLEISYPTALFPLSFSSPSPTLFSLSERLRLNSAFFSPSRCTFHRLTAITDLLCCRISFCYLYQRFHQLRQLNLLFPAAHSYPLSLMEFLFERNHNSV